MIKLNRERFKSVLLLSLVILSFILTTRIWFDTSIEGIFVMQRKDEQKEQNTKQYDKSELLRPHKMIVNFGEKSTIQYNNRINYEAYDKLFFEAKKIIRDSIIASGKNDVNKLHLEELDRVRKMRGIDLIFNSPLEVEAVFRLLDIDISSTYIGAEYIDEIVVAINYEKLYIIDASQSALFELNADKVQNNLDYIISSVEKLPSTTGMFLNKFQPAELYGRNVVVPAKLMRKEFPVLSSEKELLAAVGIPKSIAAFFNDDVSSLSIIKNTDGTKVYTDRENRIVNVYINGTLEYVDYDVQPAGVNSVNARDAVDISTEFISKHFDFPQYCYISDIVKSMQGDKYIIRYRYMYEGLPIVLDSRLNNDTIEIEIVDNKVRRYKRAVRVIKEEIEAKQVLDSIDILDILLGESVRTLSGEKITRFNDLYLAYYERSYQDRITYIPVWVADVEVESLEEETALKQKKRYIINAETGIILDK